MIYKVHITHIAFTPDPVAGTDGAVWYLITAPCEICRTRPDHHACAIHPGMWHYYERQPFRRGAAGHRRNATPQEIAEDHANVWGWDGSVTAPTVLPSFLALAIKNGTRLRPYQLHSFLRAGRLELCADSTVILDPDPQSCWDV